MTKGGKAKSLLKFLGHTFMSGFFAVNVLIAGVYALEDWSKCVGK